MNTKGTSLDERMEAAQIVHYALDWMSDHEIMSDRTAQMYHSRMHMLECGWMEEATHREEVKPKWITNI